MRNVILASLRMTWQAAPWLAVGLLLVQSFLAVLPPITLALTGLVIDALSHQASNTTLFLVLLAIAIVLNQLAQPYIAILNSLAGDKLSAAMNERLIMTINGWPGLARFEDATLADDLRHLREGADRFGLELLLYVMQALVVLVTTISTVVLLAVLHPLLPLVLLVLVLPYSRSTWSYNNLIGSHLYVQTPASRRLEYLRSLALEPQSAKDVRLFGMQPFLQERYQAIFQETTAALNRLRLHGSLRMALAALLAWGGVAALFAWLLWEASQGRRTAGELLMYTGAGLLLVQQWINLADYASMLPEFFSRTLASYERVFMAAPDLPLVATAQAVPETIQHGIIFEHVAFHYPNSQQPILQDVSFQIASKESVALVGLNGAGKTTLVKLLLRFYDPTAGRILLDGVDLRDYDPQELRKLMGVIFQDFVRYELSAGENIGLGQVEALHDTERIWLAAQRSGADALLHSLPDGLDTALGSRMGGRELSGGEWQKLALGRAFMRNTPLLVLDEPTAAIDTQTEYEIYQRFHDLTRDRMTLLISHRFSTVRMADRIVLLEDGHVVEQGSHAELMACGGSYARLYQLQAAHYLENENNAVEKIDGAAHA